jgi:hypothetical protein
MGEYRVGEYRMGEYRMGEYAWASAVPGAVVRAPNRFRFAGRAMAMTSRLANP